MKTSPTFNKKLRYKSLTLVFVAFSTFFLSSCLKDDNYNQQSIVSALTVINASPDAPAYDFVLNRQAVYPKNRSYTDRIDYFILNTGRYNASFYEYQTNTKPIYETAITLANGKYHSLFLAGTQADSLTSLLIQDDLILPAAEKAKLRFINLSPDAGALDFAIVTDSLFASKKDFKDYTDFYEIPAGEYKASLKSSSGTKVNHAFNLKLTAGKIYTVWARGLVETTNEKQIFEDGLIIHDL